MHYQTVARIIREHDSERKAKDSASIATRDDILRRMTILMQTADKAADSIAAAKLIAMMHGWLTPDEMRSTQSININMLGNADISVMEREYEALKAPTTHAHTLVDTSPSPTSLSSVVGQPSATLAQAVGADNVEGVEPPMELESNTLSSSADFSQNISIIPENEGK
jgi:hypothetical protein